MKIRCAWVGNTSIYTDYHDKEWGKPEYDSLKLFEMLCLEGQQAGLSWLTVLKKRAYYRQVFHQFDPEKIAKMTALDVDRLMQDSGVIRHRKKLDAIITNAKAYLAMQKCGEHFSEFIWSFVDHQPQINRVSALSDVPTKTATSLALSKALKKRGFVFVGETTCYAFMQAAGLVNDHQDDCHWK
ncbi:DNA-3-methyladenine glycosylase I [Pasteurella sp. PK-2025]|uniref:DNA-3-methyladenine glycosylase I n=1 Tax=unclassified Pasteurella TaxID=2621516 RepID=UPI003C78C674